MRTIIFRHGIHDGALGLTGYGVLRTAARGAQSTLHVATGASLANVVDGLSAQMSPEAPELAQQLRNPDALIRSRGCEGLVRLFAEVPEIRSPLIAALQKDPNLTLAFNGKNDAWLRNVDFLMGIGESISGLSHDYFERLHALLPSFTLNMRAETEAYAAINTLTSEAILPVLKALFTRTTLSDEHTWNSTKALLLTYWTASCIRWPTAKSLPLHIRYAIIVQRMLRRLTSSPGVERRTLDEASRRIDTLLLKTGDQRAYARLCAWLGSKMPSQDPLGSLPHAEWGEFLHAPLERYIVNIISRENRQHLAAVEQRLLDVLEEARRCALAHTAFEGLAEVAQHPGFSCHGHIARFEQFVRSHEQTSLSALSPVIPRRMVTWNPYAVDGDIVIHPNLGEGRIVAAEDAAGMVTVSLSGTGTTIKVFPSTLVAARDREKYLGVLRQRAAQFSFRAYVAATGALANYIDEHDPARPILDELFAVHSVHHFYHRSGIPKTLAGMEKVPSPTRIYRASRQLFTLGTVLGFDPVAWVWRLTSGTTPAIAFKFDTISKETQLGIQRRLTPDLARSFVMFRPWHRDWMKFPTPARSNLMAAGFYYPTYYRGVTPDDLTQLYFDYRGGTTEAIAAAAEKMTPLVDAWIKNPARTGSPIIVPMIGSAPNDELAGQFGYETLFPWMPRPANYGDGVEGKTLFQKMEMLNHALRLDSSMIEHIKGRSILILDDNVTDYATLMTARRLFFQAGAAEVGMVTLTQTIRNEKELEWDLR